MKIDSQKILEAAKIILLAVVLGFGVNYILADHSHPLSTPPTCISGNPGCDAPINVSGTGQIKDGGLTLGAGNPTYGLLVPGGKVGIGTITPVAQLSVGPSSQFQVDSSGIIQKIAGVTNTALNSNYLNLVANGGSAYIANNSSTANSNLILRAGQTSGYIGFEPVPSTEVMRITSGGQVGIGTTTPGTKLDVAGTVKSAGLQMTGGAPGAGKVLTSDATGNGTWQSLPGANSITVSNNFSAAGGNGGSQTTNMNGTWSICFLKDVIYTGGPGSGTPAHTCNINGSGSSWTLTADAGTPGSGDSLTCQAQCILIP